MKISFVILELHLPSLRLSKTRVSAVPTYLAHDVADIAPSEKHDLLEIRSGGLYVSGVPYSRLIHFSQLGGHDGR